MMTVNNYLLARDLCIRKYPPSPGGGENISRCNLGEKIGKAKEKKRENVKDKGRKGKKEERGKKMRKGEVNG